MTNLRGFVTDCILRILERCSLRSSVALEEWNDRRLDRRFARWMQRSDLERTGGAGGPVPRKKRGW